MQKVALPPDRMQHVMQIAESVKVAAKIHEQPYELGYI